MIFFLLFIAVIFLAYTNGANDNFKGVATLFGSGTTNYRKAINWATATTLLGSITSIYFASELIKQFSGKDLVPQEIISNPYFLFSIALGAALTILLATIIGLPISTTHSLVGALTGVGLVAVGNQFNFEKLANTFVLPLFLSPLIAAFLSIIFYIIFSKTRKIFGITKKSCLCIVSNETALVTPNRTNVALNAISVDLNINSENKKICVTENLGSIAKLTSQRVLDVAHFISAGTVSFARGLNDTPKMLGLLIIIQPLDIRIGAVILAIAIAIGGLISAKKVGETMSKDITVLNHGQGFTANLITSVLVCTASLNALPVSTTHVSVGSLFGIGLATKNANTKTVKKILLAWLLTLPIAGLIGAFCYFLINTF